MNPAPWAVAEMGAARLGDPRRQRRAALVLTALADHPETSVPDACDSWAAIKGAYRFWDNTQIEAEALLSAHREATLTRGAESGTVLAIQDTTLLDFSSHLAMNGLGPFGTGGRLQGLHVHSVLAVTAMGVPLGLLYQQAWARQQGTTGLRHQRRARETADKESQRWLTALQATQDRVPATMQVVTIADREADIFDLFALPRPPHSDLLIRAAHDRRVGRDPTARLWETVRAAPVVGDVHLTVPRQAKRPEREAKLTLRVAAVELQPPRARQHDHALAPIPVTAVLAEETAPPANQPPLCWLLLTTLPVPDAAAARQCLNWYRHRWVIERFHYVLKSGCQLERLQLQTAARMERALATLSIVAWRLLWAIEQARATPEAPCTVLLTTLQWAALYGAVHHTTAPPPPPVSLTVAIRWIAQLGGFIGRAGDGDPGVKTLWRGWQDLTAITTTWALFHHVPHYPTCG